MVASQLHSSFAGQVVKLYCVVQMQVPSENVLNLENNSTSWQTPVLDWVTSITGKRNSYLIEVILSQVVGQEELVEQCVLKLAPKP